MTLQVLDPEVGLRGFFIRPRSSHEDFVSVHCLLEVGRKFFQEVNKTASEACVLRGFNYLFHLNHLTQETVEHSFPVLFTKGGWEHVDLFNTGLLKQVLVVKAICLQLHPPTVYIQKPQRRF